MQRLLAIALAPFAAAACSALAQHTSVPDWWIPLSERAGKEFACGVSDYLRSPEIFSQWSRKVDFVFIGSLGHIETTSYSGKAWSGEFLPPEGAHWAGRYELRVEQVLLGRPYAGAVHAPFDFVNSRVVDPPGIRPPIGSVKLLVFVDGTSDADVVVHTSECFPPTTDAE